MQHWQVLGPGLSAASMTPLAAAGCWRPRPHRFPGSGGGDAWSYVGVAVLCWTWGLSGLVWAWLILPQAGLRVEVTPQPPASPTSTDSCSLPRPRRIRSSCCGSSTGYRRTWTSPTWTAPYTTPSPTSSWMANTSGLSSCIGSSRSLTRGEWGQQQCQLFARMCTHACIHCPASPLAQGFFIPAPLGRPGAHQQWGGCLTLPSEAGGPWCLAQQGEGGV